MKRAMNQLLAIILGGGAATCGMRLFRNPPITTAIMLALAGGLLSGASMMFLRRSGPEK
jgi:hypothetical protein